MRRFRSRSRKSHWMWADRFNLRFQDNQAVATWTSHILLPASRVNWLCGTSTFRSGLTVTGILLWLDFWWENDSTTTSQALPDVDMGIMTTVADETLATSELHYDPYVQPEPPSLTTDWNSFPSDGLDPFLWTHHIKGISPCNSIIRKTTNDWSNANRGAVNQDTVISFAADGSANLVCRKHYVTQEWQPDVVVKTKRRLKSNQGLGIFMRTPGLNTGCFMNLGVNVRMLAR